MSVKDEYNACLTSLRSFELDNTNDPELDNYPFGLLEQLDELAEKLCVLAVCPECDDTMIHTLDSNYPPTERIYFLCDACLTVAPAPLL
jgi:hypothetical protein